MTVYVDDAQIGAKVGRFDSTWSHLMADSVEELIEFATKQLGFKAKWLQNKRSGMHFDVTEPKRQMALRKGAVSLPIEEFEEWQRIHQLSMQQYLDYNGDKAKKFGEK